MREASIEVLADRYRVTAPRFTSYPAVSDWESENFELDRWKDSINMIYRETVWHEGISLYIHLPFCESLCTYCGCNAQITINHAIEGPYIEALLKEWSIYFELFPARPLISEIHLGGGTPTFFSAQNLKKLIQGIKANSDLTPDCSMSFEAHPDSTRIEHLKVLYEEGFRQMSLGIQDFDLRVQEAIHRYQSVPQVQLLTGMARELGFSSINFDLIYGLPFQNAKGLRQTLDAVIGLRPDRISFYCYAYQPWIKAASRKFDESDLPKAPERIKLYQVARDIFQEGGYVDIGMDHFALPHDALAMAKNNGTLHRNFKGYSDRQTQLLIGLGVSAISDSWYAFARNEKTAERYFQKIESAQLPVFKGHLLNREDLVIRRHMLNIMCKGETSWEHFCTYTEAISKALPEWQAMQADGFLKLDANRLKVTSAGMPFLRNVCLPLDFRHRKSAVITQNYIRAM